jgi:hypothetical protein
LEKYLKKQIMTNYKTDDFELEKLFIGLTIINNYRIQTQIYSDFENLEDAINCCIASSHIPFVTGSLINKYKNDYTFDGGFSKFPYLMCKKPVLHITPYMWNENEKNSIVISYTSFLKHTKNIYCIDIDEEGIKSALELPEEFGKIRLSGYINGNTKGIHIYKATVGNRYLFAANQCSPYVF